MLKSVVEGLIFAHPEPLSLDAILPIIREASAESIQEVLDELERKYLERSRGFLLARVAGGYQFRSLPDVAPWILEMKSIKPYRLSRAALETLSIIAYNQPVAKSRIERVRGVESTGPLKTLLEKGLIAIDGRQDAPGRPLLYKTTKRFLEVFGLGDLSSLPPLPAIEEMADQE